MKVLTIRSLGVIALAILMAGAVSGCKSGGAEPIDPGFSSSSDSGGQGGPGDEITTIDGLPDIDSATLFSPSRGLQTIYFDYNSFSLRSDALDTLRANAEMIKRVPGVVIQIEGHCDERGTQEYNLTLGEKRALATREHLMNLGISGDRMITISYGEEDPVSLGHDESAWSQNRRGEFNQAM